MGRDWGGLGRPGETRSNGERRRRRRGTAFPAPIARIPFPNANNIHLDRASPAAAPAPAPACYWAKRLANAPGAATQLSASPRTKAQIQSWREHGRRRGLRTPFSSRLPTAHGFGFGSSFGSSHCQGAPESNRLQPGFVPIRRQRNLEGAERLRFTAARAGRASGYRPQALSSSFRTQNSAASLPPMPSQRRGFRMARTAGA